MKIDLSKILEIFNSLNDRVRYSIFGVAVLLIFLFDIFFLTMPQYASIGDVNDQIKKLSEDTAQVLSDKQKINQLKKNLEDTRLKLEAMNNKIRPLQEVPAILGVISRVANECGVKIDQLMPQKQGLEKLTASQEGQYYALPIVIQARCGYHMFGRFLNRLENEDLYSILKDLTVQNDEKDPHAHIFSMTIKIILLDKARG